jgi:hypothetical protein
MADRSEPNAHGVIPEDEDLDKQRMQTGRQLVEESLNILRGNARDAVAFEEELNASPATYLEFWSRHLNIEPTAILREPSRRMHNWLASVKTLVDHSRSHIERVYKRHSFCEEYHNKVEGVFGSSDLLHFVQDLRNFNLHFALPVSRVELNLNFADANLPKPTGLNFQLSRDELLKWNRWTQQGRRFLMAQTPKITMTTIITQYMALVEPFYQWLASKEVEMFNRAMVAQNGPHSRVAREARRASQP